MSFIKILIGDKKESDCCSIEIKEVKSEDESCCENDKKDNKCCV
ncbi:hypothetical protein ACFW35_16515 [Fictibacillus sp. NPDC058756]|jgi:hypothetical protein